MRNIAANEEYWIPPMRNIAKEKKEVLEVEDNCHLPSGNASGSVHSRWPYEHSCEHFTIDEKAK